MIYTETYLKQWIKDIYPGVDYTNSLSLKWVVQFAEEYYAYRKRIGEPKPMKKWYLKIDYVTSEIREIKEATIWRERIGYPKCYNRGGGVNGLYYEIWAEDEMSALAEYDKFCER